MARRAMLHADEGRYRVSRRVWTGSVGEIVVVGAVVAVTSEGVEVVLAQGEGEGGRIEMGWAGLRGGRR